MAGAGGWSGVAGAGWLERVAGAGGWSGWLEWVAGAGWLERVAVL